MEVFQADLFTHVVDSYIEAGGELSNTELYASVARKAGLTAEEAARKSPIGKRGTPRSTFTRSIRWHQQTLRQLNILSRSDSRGVWKMAVVNNKGLAEAADGTRLVAFSTSLGLAIWGNCKHAFDGLAETVDLVVTSPPYLLNQARNYGNPQGEQAYIDFICSSLEPVIEKLAPTGSLCLNIGNDCFVSRSPARSLYRERLVLAICDRFSLHKMDELIWVNPSRPPGPIAWASKQRVQLNSGYEPIYWFAKDPHRVKADNRRVLEPHTKQHLELMMRGGEAREAHYGDGAFRIRHGSFGAITPGRIPRNVITRSHTCPDTRQYRRDATALGLPCHGAMQPVSVPDFLIRYLSEPGDLIVDPFGGTAKTGMAAERNGRRWMVVERILQYLRGSAARFECFPGYTLHQGVANAFL